MLDDGNGPAIVLLHGFPLAKEIWDVQAAALASHMRVVRLDLRGLGGSSVSPGPYLMEALAGDLADTLDALGIERAAIVGHSLGGFVTFAFYRMFAERCTGLGFVASRPTADTDEAAAARLALAVRAEREGIAPVAEWFMPRLFAPVVYQREPQLVARLRAIVERTDPRGAAAMLRGMAVRVSSEDLFDEIDVPVAIVAGSRDSLLPLDVARAMAERIGGSELVVHDGGHVPQLESPEIVSAALARLVTRVGARS